VKPHRRLRHFAVAALVAVLGLTIAASGSSVAAAASVTITQQGFTIVGDAAWRVVVDTGDAAGDNLNLDIVTHRRVNTRGELTAAIGGRLPDELDRLRLPVAGLTRNSAGRLVVSVPTATNTAGDDSLLFGNTGVYPITVELRAGESVLGSTSTFVHHVDPDDALTAAFEGTLQVMNVASLSAAPARTATGENAPSPLFAQQLSDLTAAYDDETGGAFVSLQADQVAVAGSDAFTALRAQGSRHTVAATPFVPLNPSAVAGVGLSELFASQLRAGEDAVAAALGVTADRGVMVIDDKLTADGAVLLRDVGVRGVILTSRAVDLSGFRGAIDSALTYRARAADGSTILVQGIDATYAGVLGDESRSPLARAVMVGAGLVLQRESLLGMGKDLSLVSVALGTDDARPANPAVLQQLFRLVGSSPVLKVPPTPRPAVAETTGDVLDLSAGTDTSLSRAKSQVDQLTPRVNNIVSMLTDNDPRRETWPAMLTTLLSSRTDATLNTALVANLRESTKALIGALELPGAANFTLSSRKAELRLQVRNTSDTTLRAVVRFRSAKLKFPKARQVLEVPANASAEVVINVEARSNGRFPVSVQLLTPRGDLALSEPVTITANVSAIAGLGQVVTATALLVLLTWWAHNWRSKRRRAIEAALAVVDHPSRHLEHGVSNAKN